MKLPVADEIAFWARRAFMLERLRLVCDRFREGHVRLVPVKGVILAPRLYHSALERPFADIDLLVQPSEFRRALSIVSAQRWPVHWDSRQLSNANFVVDGVAFDMAASVGPPGTSALGVGTLLSRAVPWEAPNGFRHLQPEWHDHVLVMCVDAFKDKLGSKPWSREDLRRMVEVPSFDPDEFVRVAAAARLLTLVAIVADWVLETPSTPWNAVRQILPRRAFRRRYAKLVRSLLTDARRDHRSVLLGAMVRGISDSYTQSALAVALGAVGAAVYHGRRAGLLGRGRQLE